MMYSYTLKPVSDQTLSLDNTSFAMVAIFYAVLNF